MIRFAENLNKMIAAGLGGALEAPRTEVAVGHRIRYLELSGTVESFETNIVAPIRSLRVDMLPIQAGSGNPSPDNIRPISGRDSVTAVRTGKNLVNPGAITVGAIVRANSGSAPLGSVSENNSWNCTDYIPVQPSTRYTQIVPIYSAAGAAGLVFFKAKSVESAIGGVSTLDQRSAAYSFTTPAECNYVRLSYSNRSIPENFPYPILALGDAADFIPYDGASVTIQLGQTVYGGTLDVTTGTMKVEWANIASYDGETLPGEWISDRDVYAEGTTPATGAQVCYKLAEPLIVQLSPQTIATLLGQNNVWSDAGNISLEYPYYEETEGY